MGLFSQLRHTSRSSWVTIPFTLFSCYCTSELFLYHIYDWGHLSGPSMYVTIPSEGSSAWINRRYRHGQHCKVGDIIQFRNPIFPSGTGAKRIIGMPGDYVVFDRNLDASVGGTKGPWMTEEQMQSERKEPRMIQVPEGHVWVAGDNMAYSRDSRYFGPLPMGLITGKIDYVVQDLLDWKKFRGDNMIPVPVEEVD